MAPVVISYEILRVVEGEERSSITYDLLQSVMIDLTCRHRFFAVLSCCSLNPAAIFEAYEFLQQKSSSFSFDE